jgi:threonine/homoserine/homoserine lactone efflux protein
MTELVAGLSLGLGAGISPGPLLTLVVTSTLERGFGAGFRVAVSPLVTDAPIIALTVAVVSSVGGGALRLLGVVGGLTVAAMGAWSIATSGRGPELTAVPSAGRADLWRGVVVNALSPHPWIFWIGVGAPLLVTAWRGSPTLGIAFLGGFYLLLIGSKVAVAALVSRLRSRLSDPWRRRLVVIGGLLLVAGGSVLVGEALAGRL